MIFRSLPLVILIACTGRGDTGQTDDTSVDTGETDGACSGTGFSVAGTAIDLESGEPAAEGLCASIMDPTPTLAGGEPAVLGTSVIEVGGTFEICNIVTSSAIGILMVVDDCASGESGGLDTDTDAPDTDVPDTDGPDTDLPDTDAPDTDLPPDGDAVIAVATGIGREDYQELGAGDSLTERVAYSITTPYATAINADFAEEGSETNLDDGALVGFIRSNEEPIDGGVVTCVSTNCTPTVYYADTNPVDGLFTTDDALNTSAIAAAGSLYMIPGAEIKTYIAEADGYEFQSRLAGSIAGFVVFVTWNAVEE